MACIFFFRIFNFPSSGRRVSIFLDHTKNTNQSHTKHKVMSSQLHGLANACHLCWTQWGQLNHNSIIEQQVLLPCGALFGGSCLKEFMSSGTENRDDTDKRRCPICNRTLWYKGCGHTVRPDPVILFNDPQTDGWISLHSSLPVQLTTEVQMPENCRDCAMRLLPYRRALFNSQTELANYRNRRAGYVRRGAEWNLVAEVNAQIKRCEDAVEADAQYARTEWSDFEMQRRGW
jgi:hypothetical protein